MKGRLNKGSIERGREKKGLVLEVRRGEVGCENIKCWRWLEGVKKGDCGWVSEAGEQFTVVEKVHNCWEQFISFDKTCFSNKIITLSNSL